MLTATEKKTRTKMKKIKRFLFCLAAQDKKGCIAFLKPWSRKDKSPNSVSNKNQDR